MLKRLKHKIRRIAKKVKEFFKKKKELEVVENNLIIKGELPYEYYYAFRNTFGLLTEIETAEVKDYVKKTTTMEVVEFNLTLENNSKNTISNLFFLVGPRIIKLEEKIKAKENVNFKRQVIAHVITNDNFSKDELINVEKEKCLVFYDVNRVHYTMNFNGSSWSSPKVIEESVYQEFLVGLKRFNTCI